VEQRTRFDHRGVVGSGDDRGARHRIPVASGSECYGRCVDKHRVADDGLLLVDRGSTIVESLVATAVVFLLIAIVTQVAFVVVARETAQTAVTAAARRAGRPGADLGVERARLAEELTRVVPGAAAVTTSLGVEATAVTASASIQWSPPGPDLIPITLHATATAPIVVPP